MSLIDFIGTAIERDRVIKASSGNLAAVPRNTRGLSLVPPITDHDLTRLDTFSNLEILDLSGQSITDSGLASLPQSLPLEVIDLSGCDAITDNGVQSLSRFASLRTIAIQLNTNISSRSIEGISRLSLTKLMLDWSYLIDDAALKALAPLQTLTTLTLSGCERITDVGVAAVAKLRQLRNLRLPEFSAISDVGIAALASHLSELEILEVSNIEISDQALLDLSKVSSLRYLLLDHVPTLSTSAIETFKRARPRCNVST
jgi:F-box/leucine-rich repeat protein 14